MSDKHVMYGIGRCQAERCTPRQMARRAMALRPGWQGCSAAMSLSQWRLRLPQAISIQEIDRSGQVAVLGVPNSGKSSLVNELVGTKARLSIITLAAVFIWAGMLYMPCCRRSQLCRQSPKQRDNASWVGSPSGTVWTNAMQPCIPAHQST